MLQLRGPTNQKQLLFSDRQGFPVVDPHSNHSTEPKIPDSTNYEAIFRTMYRYQGMEEAKYLEIELRTVEAREDFCQVEEGYKALFRG
jgi:hypothetical protein